MAEQAIPCSDRRADRICALAAFSLTLPLDAQLPEDGCIPISVQDIRSLTSQPARQRTFHSWHIVENTKVHSDSSLCDEEDEKAEDVREQRQEENHGQ